MFAVKTKNKDFDRSEIFEAILKLENTDEAKIFFEDLCTISELNAMAQRLLVAKLLKEDMVYSDIAAKTGASSATISRVARCLNYGDGGYNTILQRLE